VTEKSGLATQDYTVTRLEAKQSRVVPSFFDTRINSLVGCTFWGSDECAPVSFFLSSNTLFFMQQNHVKVLSFHIKTFLEQQIQILQYYLKCLHYSNTGQAGEGHYTSMTCEYSTNSPELNSSVYKLSKWDVPQDT